MVYYAQPNAKGRIAAANADGPTFVLGITSHEGNTIVVIKRCLPLWTLYNQVRFVNAWPPRIGFLPFSLLCRTKPSL